MEIKQAVEKIKENICGGKGAALFCRDSCMYGDDKCAYQMGIKALEEREKYKEYVLCDECQYCEESEDFGIYCRFCRKENGLNGHLEPGTGCTRGKRK